MRAALYELGPFDSVLDVGGNVGDFAELARELWSRAYVTSFEPLEVLADANRKRAEGRWWVENYALTRWGVDELELNVCLNQHSASTLEAPGPARRERFGIKDSFDSVAVKCRPLDHYRELVSGRTLIKIDVEGHEGRVLEGAGEVLDALEPFSVVIVECNQTPDVFEGAPAPYAIDAELRRHGLVFCGVLGVLCDRSGAVVQFDGYWRR